MTEMGEFNGYWRTTWMEAWETEYIDMEEPGYFLIGDDHGHFVFGTVRGDLDARKPSGNRLEFSWAGQCEFDEMNGRGWLELEQNGVAEGRIFIHFGDESDIRLEKA